MQNLLNAGGDAGQDPEKAGSPEPRLLTEPSGGVPSVIDDDEALGRALTALAEGTGPVAVDAERASGYRYTQRAYLVQLWRHGAGVLLIDPIACPDLAAFDEVLADTELVIHAAQQDLACLADLGLRPRRLFDTELAGRLLGYPKVALGVLVEKHLGVRLAKEHSAADWSQRPLPTDWLRYAALDVDLLVELRDALERELHTTGKLEWATEEFAAELTARPKPPRADPWRRTSGIHRVRTQRGLAAVRELWLARDEIAQEKDLAPGRVLHDKAIVEAALAMPRSVRALMALPVFHSRRAREHAPVWAAAIERARTSSSGDLPRPAAAGEGPPPANRWADRAPEAARRLEFLRATVSQIAEDCALPTENLLHPEVIRRLAWDPPLAAAEETVGEQLRRDRAREWQIALTSAPLTRALKDADTS